MTAAILTISRNGGAPASGGIVCSLGDVIQISAVSKTGWGSNPAPHWEIYGYPQTFACPAGWTDSGTGTYFFDGSGDPPSFTLPAAANDWGKFMFRLTVWIGGGANIIDEKTALSVLSSNGVADIGWLETNQFDAERQWTGDQQRNLRLLAAGGTQHAPNVAEYATTTVFDLSIGDIQVVTLTGNITTLTIENGIAWREYIFSITQDATGGRTIAWPGSVRLSGGSLTLSGANKTDLVRFIYDGTNFHESGRSLNLA